MIRVVRNMGGALTFALGLALAGAVSTAGGCGGDNTGGAGGQGGMPAHHGSGTFVSSSLAILSDDRTLWVVNQDSDSVSVIDVVDRKLIAEIPLGDKPAVDPGTKRFDPKIAPRALAVVDEKKVYVAGQSANRVYVIDAEAKVVKASIDVPAAPVGIAAAPDGSAVYVVSHEAATVTKIDPKTDTAVGGVAVSEHPWGAALRADGKELYVTHLLLDPGVSIIDTATLAVSGKTKLRDEAPGADKRLPNGVARGAYDISPRPGTGELWASHLLLAVETPQPELDFESTVFPTITAFAPGAKNEARRLLFQPLGVPGAKGSFSDSVSGPRAVAFTPSGKLALVALAQSEDVMIFDAESGNEVSLVRPLPSALLEGIAVDHAGKRAFVDGRNTHNVTVLSIDEGNSIAPVVVDGAPIERLTADPMPAELRLGQRLFYTANSAAFPITKNFWVACATCHIEGGSDAVTWLFDSGPRDTPSNAGGPVNTGFLLRQGLRNSVQQYDETIRVEQGGAYDVNDQKQKGDLDALAAYVNYAIPFPQNPNIPPGGALTDAQQRGKTTFQNLCASCHPGPYYTDSAAGNPGLDLSQAVVLHDIGTCVKTGKNPDAPKEDVLGNAHAACDFDTPTLRGIFATAPYFHDGSAATLKDVVDRLQFSSGLSEPDKADLVAYLLTL